MYPPIKKDKFKTWNWLTDSSTFLEFGDKLAFLSSGLTVEQFANKVAYGGGLDSVHYLSKIINEDINK